MTASASTSTHAVTCILDCLLMRKAEISSLAPSRKSDVMGSPLLSCASVITGLILNLNFELVEKFTVSVCSLSLSLCGISLKSSPGAGQHKAKQHKALTYWWGVLGSSGSCGILQHWVSVTHIILSLPKEPLWNAKVSQWRATPLYSKGFFFCLVFF